MSEVWFGYGCTSNLVAVLSLCEEYKLRQSTANGQPQSFSFVLDIHLLNAASGYYSIRFIVDKCVMPYITISHRRFAQCTMHNAHIHIFLLISAQCFFFARSSRVAVSYSLLEHNVGHDTIERHENDCVEASKKLASARPWHRNAIFINILLSTRMPTV